MKQAIVSLVLLSTSLGCGGRSTHSDGNGVTPETPEVPAPGPAPGATPTEPGAAPPAPASPPPLSMIATGQDEVCGLTKEDRRLVCLRGDTVVSEEPGPFRDFAMQEDISSWVPRCSVKESGELRCTSRGEDFDLGIPDEPFVSVSVGFFNICALAESGSLHCFIPAEIGGLAEVPTVVGPYSVDMYSMCMQTDMQHAECFSSGGLPLLPPEGHYLRAVAAPDAGCAAVLPTPEDSLSTALDPTAREALSKPCIACFSPDAVTIHAEGWFVNFDVDVNQHGCALDRNGSVTCWGDFEENFTADLGPDIVQISVSSNQACALDGAGSVRCWRASFE